MESSTISTKELHLEINRLRQENSELVKIVTNYAETAAQSYETPAEDSGVKFKRESDFESIRLLNELSSTLDKLKELHGFVPICSCCKKIRDTKGAWEDIESYISKNTGVMFTHSLCPDCVDELYPDFKCNE
ncbi:MAG: hypothetical protein JEY99_11260 [Spirochaetales bacterium]|nr:hypothetical protein [Spirochaetales bacterium]